MDINILNNARRLMDKMYPALCVHIGEIVNNASYQHHKGIIKARRREISEMKDLLDIADKELENGLKEIEEIRQAQKVGSGAKVKKMT